MSFFTLLCARDLYYPDTPTIKNVSQSNQWCNQLGGSETGRVGKFKNDCHIDCTKANYILEI